MAPSDVTLYPTGDAVILGDPVYGDIPSLITEADAAAAAALLAYSPPAFVTEPTPFSDALEEGKHPHRSITSPPDTSPPPGAPGASGALTEPADDQSAASTSSPAESNGE